MELSTIASNKDHRKWVDKDCNSNGFRDKRLQQRFRKLLEQIWNGLGQNIPFACQGWANTKGAYRFLSNDNVSERFWVLLHIWAKLAMGYNYIV